MATKATAPAPSGFAALAKSAVSVGGSDLHDKAELVGVELVISTARFTVNDRGVEFVYLTGFTVTEEEFEFNDSSRYGVRQQVKEYLEGKGLDTSPTSGEIHELSPALWVPRGLRVSNFEVQDRGVIKQAKCYYLTSKRGA